MLQLGQRNESYHESLVGGLSLSAVGSDDWISPDKGKEVFRVWVQRDGKEGILEV